MASRELIDKLIIALGEQYRGSKPQLFETHISWVIVVADYAYKIKKPVDFGFVDFSTLEKREHYCHRELSLNKRLAPDLYLEVLPICGSADTPNLSGHGEIIDWALKLKRFDPEQQLDKLANNGLLTATMIDDTIRQTLAFHQNTDIIGSEQRQGTPKQIHQSVLENIEHIIAALDKKFSETDHKEILQQLEQIQDWLQQQYCINKELMRQRKEQGCIRDCHGDLHLANMAWHDKRVIIYDCIEFNDSFRFIDVISDLAFLIMDLMHRRYFGLACLGLNRYLQQGGDYQGLPLLRYYMVYRALVRAKVSLLSNAVAHIPEAFRQYLSLAKAISNSPGPTLFITHGLSGSGKSHGVRTLYNDSFFIHIASDIERKRLPQAGVSHMLNKGIYSPRSRQQVYQHLQQLASLIMQAGLPCVVDATFLSRENRDAMASIAALQHLDFHIIRFEATADTLRQRVQQRQQSTQSESDAGISVLEQQLQNYTPLSEQEQLIGLSLEQARVKLQKFLNNFP